MQYLTRSEYLEVHKCNGSRSFSSQSSLDGTRRQTRGKLGKKDQEEWWTIDANWDRILGSHVATRHSKARGRQSLEGAPS
jgi:hypothetical protein